MKTLLWALAFFASLWGILFILDRLVSPDWGWWVATAASAAVFGVLLLSRRRYPKPRCLDRHFATDPDDFLYYIALFASIALLFYNTMVRTELYPRLGWILVAVAIFTGFIAVGLRALPDFKPRDSYPG